MHPLETSGQPNEQKIPPAIWVAIVFGFSVAFLVYIKNNPIQVEGFMRLSTHQSKSSFEKRTTVRFDLPTSWGVKYNGHQPWRGGTVVDADQRPRMEVWIIEGKKSNPSVGEVCCFAWGEAHLVTSLKENDRPYLSIPQVTNPSHKIVEWTFRLAHSQISFTVPLGEDKLLEPIIWDCMRNLRFEE